MERADLELVLAIRTQGSLAAAADSLGVAAPAVSKRLAALEATLGARLFQRTTRRVSPTAEGDAVCAHAVTLLQGFEALETELGERQSQPSGTIRLACTFGFGRLWLAPALADFQARHPRVSIQLQLTESLPDLLAQGFDAAVWLWSVQQPRAAQWVTRRLARNQRVLVAAPAYLKAHGAPAHPEALGQHSCLVVRENGSESGQRFDNWQLVKDRERKPTQVRVQGPLASNSGEVVRDWCLDNRGIMLRSLWDIAPLLASVNLFGFCLNGPCPMPMCIGWHPTGPRYPAACACCSIFWRSSSAEPWKLFRGPHHQADAQRRQRHAQPPSWP
jgi:LysR family transcriptional activator of dmlA